MHGSNHGRMVLKVKETSFCGEERDCSVCFDIIMKSKDGRGEKVKGHVYTKELHKA